MKVTQGDGFFRFMCSLRCDIIKRKMKRTLAKYELMPITIYKTNFDIENYIETE